MGKRKLTSNWYQQEGEEVNLAHGKISCTHINAIVQCVHIYVCKFFVWFSWNAVYKMYLMLSSVK